jgi:2-polyprenyl-3-methyl-5-hydroxy-6-metoxy-1,4-benzoquinol methylase
VEYGLHKTRKRLFDKAKQIIAERLNDQSEVRVLDLGSGNGAFLINLANSFKNQPVKLVGIDISKSFVDYANEAAKIKNLPHLKFQCLDVDRQQLEGKFEVVVSSEVLEHLQFPQKVLKNIYKVLSPGGGFLLSTPNGNNWIKYPFFFIKKFVEQRNTRQLESNLTQSEETFKLAEEEQHINVYNHANLKEQLVKAGFKIEKMPRSSLVFGGEFLDNHPSLWALVMLLDVILDYLPFPQLGWDSIFFCLKEK